MTDLHFIGGRGGGWEELRPEGGGEGGGGVERLCRIFMICLYIFEVIFSI